MANEDYCLSIIDLLDYDNIAPLSIITADSTMNDGILHSANKIIDGSDDFWLSSPGIESVNIILTFPNLVTVNKLRIGWKYKPSNFKIEFYKTDLIKDVVSKVVDNDDDSFEYQFSHLNLFKI